MVEIYAEQPYVRGKTYTPPSRYKKSVPNIIVTAYLEAIK